MEDVLLIVAGVGNDTDVLDEQTVRVVAIAIVGGTRPVEAEVTPIFPAIIVVAGSRQENTTGGKESVVILRGDINIAEIWNIE